MTAKEQAVLDIQEDLKKEKKSFINFIKGLDPIMFALEHEWIARQEERKSWCVSAWTLKMK
jgi:hypothetical protein